MSRVVRRHVNGVTKQFCCMFCQQLLGTFVSTNDGDWKLQVYDQNICWTGNSGSLGPNYCTSTLGPIIVTLNFGWNFKKMLWVWTKYVRSYTKQAG